MKASLEKINLTHVTLLSAAVAVVLSLSVSWSLTAIVLGAFAFRIAQRFVPEKQDALIQRLNELEERIEQNRIDSQTEISKLNVMLGVGNTQKNRENLIRGLTGMDVGSPR